MATLLQWNCRGYRANYEDLQLLINYNQPYCECLLETQLGLVTPKWPTGYSMYTDPPWPAVPGQGLAILVRDDVPTYMINVNTTLATIVVGVKSQHEYTICNLYVPPNENIGQNRFLNLINQLPDPYLIGDDPNARNYTWSDYTFNNNGRIIDNILLKEDICLLNSGKKTHFDIHRRTETCPDISLCSPRIAIDLTWETIH